jgi:polyhydroxyalkanoate synthesis regulator phasin
MSEHNNTSKRPEVEQDHLLGAYERMLQQARDAVEDGAKLAEESTPKLRQLLERIRDNMVELGELTREEGQKLADYVQRDIEDAAHYLVETGDDLRDWWRFDLELMERRMLDAFTSVADMTSLELSQWAERARRATLYQAGQVTGPGTLVCDRCGAETHFTRVGRIPACAECGGLEFRRPDQSQPPR